MARKTTKKSNIDKNDISALLRSSFGAFYYWGMRHLRLEPNVYGLINNEDSSDYLVDIIKLFEEVQNHTHKYYTISICPSAGKTIIMQLFILYSFVRNPFSKFLVYSYTAEPANEYNSNIAYWVSTPAFASMFPYLTIDPALANRSRTRFLFRGNRAGEILTDGIRGTTTGFRAGSDAGKELINNMVNFSGAIIIDDPIKASDADSMVERDNTWRSIENGILNRGNKSDTPAIMIMQRLHKDDPVGRMKAKFGDTGLLRQLSIKALRDDTGRSICEAKISTQSLLIEKDKNFPYFSSQYQQEPLSENNKVYDVGKISELMRDIDAKEDIILHSFITIDTAEKDKKSADFTVFSHFYLIATPNYKEYMMRESGRYGKFYIPDYHNDNIMRLVLNEILVEKIPAHKISERFDYFFTQVVKHSAEKPSIILVEEQACGTALVGHLKDKRGDPSSYDGHSSFTITGIRPHTAKIDRLRKASPHISAGILMIKHQKYRLSDFTNANNTNTALLNHMDMIENVKDNIKDDIADTIASAIDYTFYNIIDSEGRKLGRLFYDSKNRLIQQLEYKPMGFRGLKNPFAFSTL